MSKSFVLKRPDGTLAGYLVAGPDALRLRAEGLPAAGGELTLLDQESHEARRALDSTQQEQSLRGMDEELADAYAMGGGRVLFATSEAALKQAARALAEREAWKERETAQRRRNEGEHASSAERPAGETDDAQPEKAGREDARTYAQMEDGRRAILMQRRWPPPPCLRGAHNEHGQWLLLMGKTAGKPGEPQRCDGT